MNLEKITAYFAVTFMLVLLSLAIYKTYFWEPPLCFAFHKPSQEQLQIVEFKGDKYVVKLSERTTRWYYKQQFREVVCE